MKKTAAITATAVTDICCDICQQSVIPSARMQHADNFDNFSEHAQLVASFGYGSKRDGERYHYDFCEACFEQLLATIEGLKIAQKGFH